jgi:hypothetical protein
VGRAGPVIDFLRLFTGALGATFAPGMRRSVITATATLGIRGTGAYIEAVPGFTYACTCFGATEIRSTATGTPMGAVSVSAEHHQARIIQGDMRIAPAASSAIPARR